MALQQLYGGHLCIGPPLEAGFYYDIFVGNDKKIAPDESQDIEKKMNEIKKQAETFERLVVTKEQALEMFQDNPFRRLRKPIDTQVIPEVGLRRLFQEVGREHRGDIHLHPPPQTQMTRIQEQKALKRGKNRENDKKFVHWCHD